jgi:arginase
MTIDLIYAKWPNSPGGIHWYKMADTLREAGLTAQLEKAGFDVNEHVLTAEGNAPDDLSEAFRLGARIGRVVAASHESGGLSIIVCGSCSVAALGAISGLGAEHTGVAWMDAHADINTPETTLSGLFEGMPVAMLLGEAWQAMCYEIAGIGPISLRNLCYYGVRSIDPAEQAKIDEENIPIAVDAEAVIEVLDGCERAYVHLDMDVHNAARLKVSPYSAKGGPSPTQIRKDLVAITAALPVAAVGVTAIDPDVADGKAAGCAIEHVLALAGAWRRRAES